MALFHLQNISLTFTADPILQDISFQIENGERLCIVGRNGEGKSTLLKIISGEQPPDSGEIFRSKELKIGFLPQDAFIADEQNSKTVFEIVAKGLISQDEWQKQAEVQRILSHLQLEASSCFKELSGGTKRRVLLARTLVSRPDILLLDEPTNHLDLQSLLWLEDFLLRRIKTLVFITHDRAFLRRIATRIIEIDRGRIFDWTCNYDTFLQRRETLLNAELEQEKRFDKKLSEEEAWIRKSIKARRTRNEGRVRELKKMRQERKARRKHLSQANIQINEGERSGNLVAKIKNLTFSYDNKVLIKNFSTQIMRGERIGIIGANGIGKTTLIKLLFGNLPPDSGTIKIGTNIELIWFDQLREQLDSNTSVKDTLAAENDWVETAKGRRHVLGYLKDFLFEPQRSMLPVRMLSGGERARLLLARLFLKPSNVLILDEPTNDLDIETLELLEEKLSEYKGTLLVISHDRAFLNNVVSGIYSFEGGGQIGEYDGGYDDWLLQRPKNDFLQNENHKSAPKSDRTVNKKRSFKEQWQRKQWQEELETLPEKIDAAEQKQRSLQEKLADPILYRDFAGQIKNLQTQLTDCENELENLLTRWELLETELAK